MMCKKWKPTKNKKNLFLYASLQSTSFHLTISIAHATETIQTTAVNSFSCTKHIQSLMVGHVVVVGALHVLGAVLSSGHRLVHGVGVLVVSVAGGCRPGVGGGVKMVHIVRFFYVTWVSERGGGQPLLPRPSIPFPLLWCLTGFTCCIAHSFLLLVCHYSVSLQCVIKA